MLYGRVHIRHEDTTRNIRQPVYALASWLTFPTSCFILPENTWLSGTPTENSTAKDKLTRRFLRLVASDCTRYGIELPLHAVGHTLDVAFSLSGSDLGLAFKVLFLAALRPGGSASRIANGLDDSTFNGVISTWTGSR